MILNAQLIGPGENTLFQDINLSTRVLVFDNEEPRMLDRNVFRIYIDISRLNCPRPAGCDFPVFFRYLAHGFSPAQVIRKKALDTKVKWEPWIS